MENTRKLTYLVVALKTHPGQPLFAYRVAEMAAGRAAGRAANTTWTSGQMSNDHYVPQMYLRNFAPNGSDRRCIRLINLAHRKYVPNASIKGQCKRPGFHDYNPEVERALGVIEGHAATVIKQIIATDRPPVWLSNGHQALAAFTALQRSRTVAAAEASETMMDSMLKLSFEETAKADGLNVWDFEFRQQYPVALPLTSAARICPYAVQLGIHLFANEADQEFITSDNPVVVHNRFCEGVTHRGVLGWNNSGVLVIMPISPRHIVLLYDTGVYAVGARRQQTSKISDSAEVENMNAFQILNGLDNVYFCDANMAGPLLSQFERLAPKRKTRRIVTVQTEQVAKGDKMSEIIHQYERLIPLSLVLKSLRIKRSMKRVPLEQRATMYRVREPAEPSGARPERPPSSLYPVRRSFSV